MAFTAQTYPLSSGDSAPRRMQLALGSPKRLVVSGITLTTGNLLSSSAWTNERMNECLKIRSPGPDPMGTAPATSSPIPGVLEYSNALELHHEKRWAGGSTSWNQDCWKKYQQPHLCRWHHHYGRKWRRTKEPLDESEIEEWKRWLKAQHSENEDHGIWAHTSWQIDGETVETVTGFILGGSKITADGDCSHEIKRCLLIGRKDMTNLDSIFKSRDTTLPTKVHIVRAMFFLVVTYECVNWTIKKADC